MKKLISRFTVKLALRLLKSNRLQREDMAKVMAALLENIGALPIRSVITTDPSGSIFVGGKKLSVDQTVSFRESMAALGDNHARKILRDQVAWLAVEHGVHKGLNEDMIMFAKAILWYAQEENNLIRTLSSTEED